MVKPGDLVQIDNGHEILSSFAVVVEVQNALFSVVKIIYGRRNSDPKQHIEMVTSVRRADLNILDERHYNMANTIRRAFGLGEVKQNPIQ